jgi:acetylornithine deacetylase/succinyl-diaminopimelate desuccinylase-like protein
VRAVETELGYRPKLMRWQFSTDGTYTMGVAGIPTVGFGPGEDRLAHVTNEHIHLEDMYQAASVYAGLAANILSETNATPLG